ncbi:alpha/beta-hydrolase [Corynespora cassiicola Philippines]|uniref:Alpha/beta-hydrolase n=1 Tax=Corynespora cassiicola Philippines TaxID=1448308 RepID=A0A2T2N447_CORCC|nr:alpha/beta-hydrolase [Corynespora cassiicola Philippines]
MASYEAARDLFITIKGIKYAYRRFGLTDRIPLFMHIHFRGTMDHWDPAFVNPLAARRPVIILDSAGVGRSEGDIPTTFAGWAQVVVDFLIAIGLKQIDLLGFSMGGCTAQMVALNAPKGMIRRLILAGTIPSAGEGVVLLDDISPYNKLRFARTYEEQLEAFLISFFGPSERSQAAGRASFQRIHTSRPGRTDYVDVEKAKRQGMASLDFQDPKRAGDGSYSRFHELTMPTLIANGSDDVLFPTENSILMWKQLANANAQLHLYPDSGHAFLYQYASEFSRLVNDFLDREMPSVRSTRL